jgi:hypothetical protein
MRVAVILAILARSLNFHIFHPTYVFGEESGVRETLCRLAVYDSKKESFCRSLLLSVFQGEQDGAANERIESATEYVMRHVHGLLPRENEVQFQNGLNQLARSAYKTWAKIRATVERYEPSFDVTKVEGFEWDTLVFGAHLGTVDQKTAIQGSRDDEILVVLPRLYIIEKNQEPRLIKDGVVLRRSQSLAAAQELEAQMLHQGSPTLRRRTSTRARTIRTSHTLSLWNGERTSEPQDFLEQGREGMLSKGGH